MTDSQRVELCQCPGCGREVQLEGEMARLSERWVIVLDKAWNTGLLIDASSVCPVCGLREGEPE